MSGRTWALRIEWHPAAVKDLKAVDRAAQLRIYKVLKDMEQLDDPRQKLIRYSGNLSDFWKLRVGDYRLVCQIISRGDDVILIIRLAHRREIYSPASLSKIQTRIP